MRPLLELEEYRKDPAIVLSAIERERLLDRELHIDVRPVRSLEGAYDLTPDRVGVIALPDRLVHIRPRFGIRTAFFLISYSLEPKGWTDLPEGIEDDATFVEVLALVLVQHLRRTLAHGPLQGYQYREEALTTVRGRIRVADQIRARFGRMIPVEAAFDEFSEDTLENRLVKAALRRLRQCPLRSSTVRTALREFDTMLAGVELATFDRLRVPTVTFNRLNQHYRHTIGLARIILSETSVEFRPGANPQGAFLVDMASIFERFLVAAVREQLHLSGSAVRHGQAFPLDRAGQVRMEPDLSFWVDNRCQLVADAKYKMNEGKAKDADLYQLLAYTVGANVPCGYLVHAAGEHGRHDVRFTDKVLEIVSLDLTRSPAEILQQVGYLGSRLLGSYLDGRRPNIDAA